MVQVQQEPTLEATGDATAGATTAAVPGPDSIHTLCTGNGSPYQVWLRCPQVGARRCGQPQVMSAGDGALD